MIFFFNLSLPNHSGGNVLEIFFLFLALKAIFFSAAELFGQLGTTIVLWINPWPYKTGVTGFSMFSSSGHLVSRVELFGQFW